MKRFLRALGIIALILISFVLLIFMIDIFSSRDELILKGYYDSNEYWDEEGFQDYTDYCKFYYKSEYDSAFKNNSLYREVKEEDIEKLVGYFEDFSAHMEASGRSNEYDFDNKYITEGDYVHIEVEEGEKFRDSYYYSYDYTIYFYDIETHTLYYIHSNS